MATVPDWARLIGQQLDDPNWRTRADIWHDEVQAQVNANTVNLTNVNHLGTASYTPVWTQNGAVTKTTDHADYLRIAGWVFLEVHLTASGGTTGTANNAHTVTLPVDPLRTKNRPVVAGWYIPSGSSIIYPLLGYRSATSTVTFVRTAAEITNPFIGITGPTTAATTSDQLTFWGLYRYT